jgi:orotate phosphoribosyltransferase
MSPSDIASLLLERSAVTLRPEEPFRYSSGILSPIYTDNRVLISYPDARDKIVTALVESATQFGELDAVAGTATAGIPWAAWIADRLELPMVYVRSKAKSHGQQNQIEGTLGEGAKTLIIEDLVSTGGSCLNAVAAVREAGAVPVGVAAIFTYGMQSALDGFTAADVPLKTLTDFKTLVEAAANQGTLDADAQAKVLEWAEDPSGWAAKMGLANG